MTFRNAVICGMSLVVVLMMVFACSKDKATSPDGGTVITEAAELSSLIDGLDRDFFEANAATVASLEFLGPLISSTLSGSGIATAAPAAEPTACFANVTLGATYQYNGSGYAAGGLSGAPPGGVRFILYLINAAGIPDVNNAIGHVDVTCTAGDAPSFTVEVVYGTKTVIQMTASAAYAGSNYWMYSGYVSSPTSNTLSLALSGASNDMGYGRGIDMTLEYPMLLLIYGRGYLYPDSLLCTVQGTKYKPYTSGGVTDTVTDWGIRLEMWSNPAGGILDGWGIWTDQWEVGYHGACIDGTIEALSLTPYSAVQCQSGYGYDPLDPMPSTAELNDVEAAYVTLTHMYVTVRDVFMAGLTAVTP